MSKKIEKEERLLTEKERDYIAECYSQIKWSNFVILFGVGFIVYAFVSFLFGLVWWGIGQEVAIGIKYGLGCFLLISFGTILWTIKHFWDLHTVIKKVRTNTMYAKEAIYMTSSGNGGTVYLEMYKNGKLKYDGYNLLVREPLQKGVIVIVLQMRGRAWVYKARKSEDDNSCSF